MTELMLAARLQDRPRDSFGPEHPVTELMASSIYGRSDKADTPNPTYTCSSSSPYHPSTALLVPDSPTLPPYPKTETNKLSIQDSILLNVSKGARSEVYG